MDPSERTPLSVGMTWAYRVTSLGLEFALPTIAGAYIDRRLGSSPWGTLVGAVLGFTAGMLHLLQIAREGAGRPPRRRGAGPTSGRRD